MTNRYTPNHLQRLRAAGLRPTIARIAVLQVFEDAGGESLSSEDIFRRLCLRGIKISLGTTYRATRQLLAHGLLLPPRGPGPKRLYRVAPAAGTRTDSAAALWAVNLVSGERVRLPACDKLHRLLLTAITDSGLALDRGQVCVEFDCAAAASPSLRS
ncbi:transcriptional repressor [Ottowia thiooxydans]|uniref:transcriptional repressor n=1 Tax=Ottowia thiooxydans TaxID=219182 RepID=UPI0006887588|nr:transcriptional repressor [Ottowia thiooxydans]